MRLNHMPCGVNYYHDYRYQRYPYFPLRGEDIAMGLLVENSDGMVTATLQWERDGLPMPAVVGEPTTCSQPDRLFFTFSIGSIEELCSITYRFHVQDEKGSATTKTYGCEVLEEEALGEPTQLIQGDQCAYVVFKQLTMSFDWAKGLRVRMLSTNSQVEGTAVSVIHHQMKDGVSLQIKRNPFCWQLKRYTKQLVACEATSFRLFVDRAGLVHQISYKPQVAGKYIVGMGERFDQVNQQGNTLLCRVVEHYAHQDNHSYLPIPFFMTEQGIGWLSNTRRRLWFDASNGLKLSLEVSGHGVLAEEWWLPGEPKELLAQLHALTGHASLPPKWAFGIWMSSNGWNTQKETLDQVRLLKEHSLTATALVLEAWSDEQTFCIFNDAKYQPLAQDRPYSYEDFTFLQDGKWPNPKAMVEELQAAGLNLLLWQIPVIKYVEEDVSPQLAADEAYAIERGYCVMNDDKTPYRITDNWFKNSLLLDFTNPEAVKWWFGKRAYLLNSLNVKGFKTDGGEFLFDDSARLHDGQTGATAHNAYPLQYIGAYNDFLREHAIRGTTFSRAGYTGAQTQPIHWAGDQVSEWSEFCAQLTAGLSAGLSGIPFWTFDIGGFAGDFPTPELYLRAVAMGAFCPVMQWHSEPRNGQFYSTARQRWNNDRSPWNLASLYKDDRIISIYRLFANLRMNLLPYIYQEAMHCAKTARPLMAHLLVDYPDDILAWGIDDQYMLGRDLLIAPILEEGAAGRRVYLPQGTWYDLFQGKTLDGGQTIDYPCPVEQLPVFVRDKAALPVNINKAGIIGTQDANGTVGNDMASYAQLAFLCFPGGSLEFEDDSGNRLTVVEGRVSGKGVVKQVLLIDPVTPGNDVLLFGRRVRANLVDVEGEL